MKSVVRCFECRRFCYQGTRFAALALKLDRSWIRSYKGCDRCVREGRIVASPLVFTTPPGLPKGTLRGGQWWVQPKFPCFAYYIVYLGDMKMALHSDPREQGSLVRIGEGKKWAWEPDELEAWLVANNFENRGSFKDEFLRELTDIINNVRKECGFPPVP